MTPTGWHTVAVYRASLPVRRAEAGLLGELRSRRALGDTRSFAAPVGAELPQRLIGGYTGLYELALDRGLGWDDERLLAALVADIERHEAAWAARAARRTR